MATPERPDISASDLVSVGRIRGPQGRRGEVAVEIKTDFPERFAAGANFLLTCDATGKGNTRDYRVEQAWFHKGNVILKFAGVESISDAEALQGLEVMIPRAQRKEVPAGMYYLADLIGCRVLEADSEIGVVGDWEETPAGVVLHVQPAGEQSKPDDEILIPFAREICFEIDVEQRVIRVALPEGLLEMNLGEPLARRTRRRFGRSGKNDD